jgi:hypothetical protein
MSNSTIEIAYIEQFESNVLHLSQQEGSRLRKYVRSEPVNGRSKMVERVAPADDPRPVTARHEATPEDDIDFSRRVLETKDVHKGTLVDPKDIRRLLIDPKGPVVTNFQHAFGRHQDKVIIDAALGESKALDADRNETTVNIKHVIPKSDGGVDTALNVQKLIILKEKILELEVPEGEQWVLVITAKDNTSLLQEDETTNQDYTAQRVFDGNGYLSKFMGFEFVRTELLPTVSDVDNTRRLFAFTKEGLRFGVTQDVVTKVGEDPTRSFNMRIYMEASFGCVRVDEDRVIEIRSHRA